MIDRVVLHQYLAVLHHQQAHQVFTVEQVRDRHVSFVRIEGDAAQINRCAGQWARSATAADHPCGVQHIKMGKSDPPLRLTHKQRAGFCAAT